MKNTKNTAMSFFTKVGLTVVTVSVMVSPALAFADVITRQLEVGSKGADVSSLQTFLAKDITLYPQGLITGYFGYLTKSAVSNFQSRNNLPAVGRIGPMTLPVLNAQMAGVGIDENAPSIMNTSATTAKNSAVITWFTDENAKGLVYYSTNPLVTFERTNSVDVSGVAVMTDANFRTGQSVTIPNLTANTRYYYMVYVTDQSGNVSVTMQTSFVTTN